MQGVGGLVLMLNDLTPNPFPWWKGDRMWVVLSGAENPRIYDSGSYFFSGISSVKDARAIASAAAIATR